MYLRQGLGVGMFRRIYGGRSNTKGKVDPGEWARPARGSPLPAGLAGSTPLAPASPALARCCTWFHIAAARSQKTNKRACCTPWSAPLARGGRPNCPTPRARHAPPTEHFAKAAGGVIRHALHNLETLGLVEKNPGAKGGRRWAPRGEGS